MAKTKTTKVDEIEVLKAHLKRWSKPVFVESKTDAIEALDEMEEIQAFIEPLMTRTVELKRAAQNYAITHKIERLSLSERGMHFTLVQRFTRMWVTTDADMPDPAPKKAKSLKEICKGKKVKVGKKMVPLFNLVTRRVADPDLINEAINKDWITEKEISKAFIEKPQAAFLQRYHGEGG